LLQIKNFNEKVANLSLTLDLFTLTFSNTLGVLPAFVPGTKKTLLEYLDKGHSYDKCYGLSRTLPLLEI
jgi:hypothetical protein